MKDISREETLRIFKKILEKQIDSNIAQLDDEKLIELICTGCPFYDKDKERLECGAFRILTSILKSGKLKSDDLKKIID